MKPLRIATKRAILASAWLAAKHRLAAGEVFELSPEADAGRALEEEEQAATKLGLRPSTALAHHFCRFEPARALLVEVDKEEGGDLAPRGRTGR